MSRIGCVGIPSDEVSGYDGSPAESDGRPLRYSDAVEYCPMRADEADVGRQIGGMGRSRQRSRPWVERVPANRSFDRLPVYHRQR